jgi:hypothetical protein
MADALHVLAGMMNTVEQVASATELELDAALRDRDPISVSSRSAGVSGLLVQGSVQHRMLAELIAWSDPPAPRSIPPNLPPRASQQGIKLQV